MAEEVNKNKKFSDLPKRSLSAIIYGALWLAAIYFGGWVLAIIAYLFFYIAAFELIKLINTDSKEKKIIYYHYSYYRHFIDNVSIINLF